MKKILHFSLLVLPAVIILTACENEYNAPGIYVDYKFKVDFDGTAAIGVVKQYGYEFLGTDLKYSFLNEEGEVITTNTLWTQETLELKKGMQYFQVTSTCYGKPNIPYGHNTKVCTIFYKTVDMAPFQLYGEEQIGIGKLVIGKNDIDHIEYEPNAKPVFTLFFSTPDVVSYVTDKGYRFASTTLFFKFYNSDGIYQETREPYSNSISTDWPYAEAYVECYGFDGWYKIKVCTVYYKRVEIATLASDSSKLSYPFDIDRVEYSESK